MKIRPSTGLDENLRFKKEIEFPFELTFGAACPLGHGAEAPVACCEPIHNKARLRKWTSAKNDPIVALIHGSIH